MTAHSATKEEALRQIYPLPQFVLLAGITDADIVTSFPAPFAGEVVALRVIVSVAATTAAKLSTLTVHVNGVAVHGTAIATTTATMTPKGKVLSGVALRGHATAQFVAGDLISVTASSTTAYVEGSAMIIVELARK